MEDHDDWLYRLILSLREVIEELAMLEAGELARGNDRERCDWIEKAGLGGTSGSELMEWWREW